ncbi:MAG: polysaccharide deacetylase family protein [Pseudomonadota bacterium]
MEPIARHDRYDHSALPERAVYDWPGGRRLAVCVSTNIERFAFLDGLGSDHTALGAPQSVRNYAWRDYGNRVGLWSLLELLDALDLPAAHNVNAHAALDDPALVARLRARLAQGDEIVAHGRSNAERQDALTEAAETRLIAETTEVLAQTFGVRPEGWLGPYLAQSPHTPDLLAEAGYRYLQDWPADDQPFWMRTRAGPILSVPYSIELNDSPALVFRQHTGREFEAMIIDQFDEMLEQSQHRPLVFSLVLHSFVVGQPFRLRALRRALQHIHAHCDRLWLTTPGAVAAHVAALPPGTVPGSEAL